MEDNTKLFESLLERATEYGKVSFDLAKLKALDKTSDIVSSLVPHSIVFLSVIVFLIFLNLGLALWIGEILDKVWSGFFIVAAFYGIAGLVLHFFMHNWLKTIVCNYFIKHFVKP